MSIISAVDVTGQATAPTNAVAPTEQVAAPEAVKTEEAISPKYAALARHQKALRHQQRTLEAQKQAFESERKTLSSELERSKSWQTRLTQDPYGVLLEAGLTADQVASLMLNQPNIEDQKMMMLQQELKSLKATQEQSETKFQKMQEQQYEDAKKQIRNDVLMLVDGSPELETIKAMNAQDAVVELIEQTFHSEGRLMTIEQASKDVEDYLVEEAMKLTQLSKIKSRFAQPQQNPQEAMKQPLQNQKPALNTLSNRMVQSTTKPLSDKERKQRAILAFQGKL